MTATPQNILQPSAVVELSGFSRIVSKPLLINKFYYCFCRNTPTCPAFAGWRVLTKQKVILHLPAYSFCRNLTEMKIFLIIGKICREIEIQRLRNEKYGKNIPYAAGFFYG
jgi:hypothetical protein